MIRSMTGDGVRFQQESGAEIARMTEKLDGETAVMTLSGELRAEIAFDLQDEWRALLMTGCHVVLDMKQVTYLSATAGELLVKSQQVAERYGRRLMLRELSAAAEGTLRAARVYDLLDYDDAKEG